MFLSKDKMPISIGPTRHAQEQSSFFPLVCTFSRPPPKGNIYMNTFLAASTAVLLLNKHQKVI